jgi:hypothetical protein
MLGCVHDHKPYVIGFNNVRTARRVAMISQFPPDVRLKRSHIIDVTSEVTEELSKLGIGNINFTSITLDVDSLVEIAKNSDVRDDYIFNVEPVEQEDFLMWSFEKNIGLIMPYDMHSEDDSFVVFKANVVDPSQDTDHFRRSLGSMKL